MAYFTYEAEGRPGGVMGTALAYHDDCTPEFIRHHKFQPPIVHVDLDNKTLPGYWTHAPGWLWSNWQAGYPCSRCGQPC